MLEIANAGLTIVGEAGDGAEALRVWRDLNGPPDPDIIVLDNHMPAMTGREVAARILEERPSQIIVLCTSFFDRATRTRSVSSLARHRDQR